MTSSLDPSINCVYTDNAIRYDNKYKPRGNTTDNQQIKTKNKNRLAKDASGPNPRL